MSKRLSRLVPMLLAMSFLSACGAISFEPAPLPPQACPAWPVAGAAVADELSRLGLTEYPALWEWVARLDKLQRQLAVTR